MRPSKHLILALAGTLLLPALAHAQIHVEVSVPSIRFEAPPPLVVVQPGVQVVRDYDEEVYFVDNSYWVRREGRWYRSNDHRGSWVVQQTPPRQIVRLQPGLYRNYRGVAVTAPPPRQVVVSPPPPTRVVVSPPSRGTVVVEQPRRRKDHDDEEEDDDRGRHEHHDNGKHKGQEHGHGHGHGHD